MMQTLCSLLQCVITESEPGTPRVCGQPVVISTNHGAPNEGLSAPWAQVTSAHSVLLNWTEPEASNGIIVRYHVTYQERPEEATPSNSAMPAFTVKGK